MLYRAHVIYRAYRNKIHLCFLINIFWRKYICKYIKIILATFEKFPVLVLTSIFQFKIKVEIGIIFSFQWNSPHHFFNLLNLGYEWIVKRDEDCWYVCGEKGGSCSECQLNGDDGYCCSQTKLDLNGDCPNEAVNAMISSSDSVIEKHRCVRKINSGKWLLFTIHRNSNSNNI